MDIIQESRKYALAEIEKFHEERKKAQEEKPFVLTSDPKLIAEPKFNIESTIVTNQTVN
jgi:hypothetical protein